jgi:hypothetical protein
MQMIGNGFLSPCLDAAARLATAASARGPFVSGRLPKIFTTMDISSAVGLRSLVFDLSDLGGTFAHYFDVLGKGHRCR